MRLLSHKRHRCLFDEAHASKHRIRKDCTQQRLPAVEEKKKGKQCSSGSSYDNIVISYVVFSAFGSKYHRITEPDIA